MTACSVCGERVEARRLCHTHYQQWRRGVPHPAPLTRTPKGKYQICTQKGCPEPHYAKRLCRRHYQRQWAGIPVEGSTTVGEAHSNSKLTVNMDRQIRTLHSQGWSYIQLGKKFGVSDDAVRDSVRRRTWKHV